MKFYGVDVTYNATVTERTIVTATDEEDAKRKIKEGSIDDVIDSFIETEDIVHFDFFQEDEVDENGDSIGGN